MAIVRHPPSVVLIPVETMAAWCWWQYRPALDRELWEFPAGSLDPGESEESAARRECEEEIGRAPARVERLGGWYPTPGFCDEQLIFFRVSDLRTPSPDSPHKPDDDENITPQTVTIAEARAMVQRGDIIPFRKQRAR